MQENFLTSLAIVTILFTGRGIMWTIGCEKNEIDAYIVTLILLFIVYGNVYYAWR